MRILATAVGLVAILAFAGCGGDDSAPESTQSPPGDDATASPEPDAQSPTPTEAPGPLFGIAGLIPPNFPNSSDDDWRTMFETFSETGDLVGVYQNWNDGPGTEGDVPQAVQLIYNVAEDEGLIPVIGLGVKAGTGDGSIASTVDYSGADPGLLVDMLVTLVHDYDVRYLLFGAEINRLALVDPDAFDNFVQLYTDAYDAVKAESPGTVMFTVFQLELMRGDAYLMGGSETRGPQWDLVGRFEERLDLLAFTTYPQLDFTDPADIPDDYFSSIVDMFGLPLGFTELGWPSEPLPVAGAEDYGGSAAEQVAFIERFGSLIGGLDVRIALWSFPNDVGDSQPAPFQTISLRSNTGAPKAGLAAWQTLAGIQ